MSHRGAEHGDAVYGEEVVARLNSFLALGYRRLAVVVGDTEDAEAAIIFWAKDEANNVEVGKIESAADIEIDDGVSVIEADAVIHQCARAEQSGRRNAGPLFKKGHSILGKVDHRYIGQEEWTVLDALDAHQLPLWFVGQSPHVGRANGAGHVWPGRVSCCELAKKLVREKADGGAKVEGEIVFLVIELAGDLNEAILRVHDCFCLHAPQFQGAGLSDREFLVGKERSVTVERNGEHSIVIAKVRHFLGESDENEKSKGKSSNR